jgi:hypothetical protein
LSYVDDLLAAYRKFVALPWQPNLAPPQRVWMAIYPPEHERRVRLHLGDFEVATKEAGHSWGLVDASSSFERWMGGHEYRDEYFKSPELLGPALPAFFKYLASEVYAELEKRSDSDGVVGLVGAGTLFGLGDAVKVSALLSAVNGAISGRLLVFFPGAHEANKYRLLDARDGWNYLATPITPTGGRN